MAQQASLIEPERMVVHTGPVIQMDDEQLFRFCQINRDLQIERTADGDIIITAPEGGSSGRGGGKLTQVFGIWAERDGTGQIFGSSTGFTLPNHAMRSPDVAWVRNERVDALTDEEWQKFLPLCPDFVLELRSPSDSLRTLQLKMEEYCQNGAQLGWLLDPVTKSVHIYRPDSAPEILDTLRLFQASPFCEASVSTCKKSGPLWNERSDKPHFPSVKIWIAAGPFAQYLADNAHHRKQCVVKSNMPWPGRNLSRFPTQ